MAAPVVTPPSTVKMTKKEEGKRRRHSLEESTDHGTKKIRHETSGTTPPYFPDHRFILAPMVGASEPAFRILCRNYGVQLAYSPMHPAEQMSDERFRLEHFPNIDADKPVICHVSCNEPTAFATAARQAAKAGCAALDLNLGCPQRTAFVGKFGSYLMDDQDLICSMIQAAADTRVIPVTCKIRLLETKEDTVRFCKRLCKAGLHAIAIHGRHRAGWERTGPGARDGPAFMDQIEHITKELHAEYPDVLVFANGNTITWEDVQNNLHLTKANGLMSAEGILDNPALFLQRYGAARDHKVSFWILPLKIQKALGKLWKLADNTTTMAEATVKKKLDKYTHKLDPLIDSVPPLQPSTTTVGDLLDKDALLIAREYIDLATVFRVSIRTAIFHTRRILKNELTRFQLMQDCLGCQSLHDVRFILTQLGRYQKDPNSFMFDKVKAKTEKEALDRKHREEGKRKDYEQRMIRKAKREGKARDYYVSQGTEVPTKETIQMLQSLDRADAIGKWNEKHKQHCILYHLDGACQRGRACAFLHVDVGSFVERDVVSG